MLRLYYYRVIVILLMYFINIKNKYLWNLRNLNYVED